MGKIGRELLAVARHFSRVHRTVIPIIKCVHGMIDIDTFHSCLTIESV